MWLARLGLDNVNQDESCQRIEGTAGARPGAGSEETSEPWSLGLLDLFAASNSWLAQESWTAALLFKALFKGLFKPGEADDEAF